MQKTFVLSAGQGEKGTAAATFPWEIFGGAGTEGGQLGVRAKGGSQERTGRKEANFYASCLIAAFRLSKINNKSL